MDMWVWCWVGGSYGAFQSIGLRPTACTFTKSSLSCWMFGRGWSAETSYG